MRAATRPVCSADGSLASVAPSRSPIGR
jgi:hypothetical protein